MKQELYTAFLEIINLAFDHCDLETLYQSTFQIINKLYKVSRIQIWEQSVDKKEIKVAYEFCKNKEKSMLEIRLSDLPLPNSTKKTIKNNAVNIREYNNILNPVFNKYNIYSIFGIDFTSSDKRERILILASDEKNIKLTEDDLTFLIKCKEQLLLAEKKIKEYKKSTEECKRLKEQNTELREKDRLKTNFITNITHELKTPLASIIGFSNILKSKNPSGDATREITEQIVQASKRLSSIVSDFLQINSLDSEGWVPNIEPCDLGELIKNSAEEFNAINNKHKIFYKITDNYPIIKTDVKLIRQVLDNFISNAVKYSPDNPGIEIILEENHGKGKGKGKKEIKVSVIDKGIGITKDETDKIFARFYRSNHKDVRKVSGSGLGLSISREIISLLKGEIEVESKLNQGSKFSFTLPIN